MPLGTSSGRRLEQQLPEQWDPLKGSFKGNIDTNVDMDVDLFGDLVSLLSNGPHWASQTTDAVPKAPTSPKAL